jgi:hypothetical protein
MDDKKIREMAFDAIDRSLADRNRTAAYAWLTRQLAIADAVRELGLIDRDDLRGQPVGDSETAAGESFANQKNARAGRMKCGINEIQLSNERLIRQAEQARERAKKLQPGPERDALLKKARQAEKIERWLSSSELEPPT